jgi:hypothetical protein
LRKVSLKMDCTTEPDVNHLLPSIIGVVLTLASSSTFAASCLEQAATFAQQICGEVSKRGSSSRYVTSSGELSAEAKVLIRQALGSAGPELKETELSIYEDVLRQQLASELVNVRQCATQMAEVALRKVCSRPVTYRTCSLPEFGQAGWAREEILQGTSGWLGGGSNQSAYCSEFIASVVSSRSLGGTRYHIDQINSFEEGRRTGAFGVERQYNYFCVVKLQSQPIYNERMDERCGVAN